MVSNYMFQQVRALILEGKSNRAIERQLGIDRKTIAKYRKLNAPPNYMSRKKKTRFDPFSCHEKTVRGLLQVAPSLSALEIFILLKDRGYVGSLRTIERRLAKIKCVPKERFFEQEYEPGEQSQFDFKESVTLPFAGGPKTAHLHFGTLPFSDFFHITGYPFKNYEAFMTGMHTFFATIGGLTENIRFDNLSPCVAKVLPGNARIYTQSFQKAADYYGFGLLPCQPGKGNQKGDVEREIRSQITRIENSVKLEGKVFADFDDLNVWLAAFCKKWRTPRTQDLWQKEIPVLAPLPPANENILSKVEMVLATSYGTVRIAKSSYSVPDSAIGKTLRVVCGPYDIKIYQTGGERQLIATHTRQIDCGNSILLQHVLPSLVRKPHAMVRWAHREFLFPKPIFKKYLDYLQKKFGYGAEREYLRTINLVHYTSISEIAAAIELILPEIPGDPFSEIKHLLLVGRHAPTSESVLNQPPLSPVLKHYDNLIPSLNPLKEAQ